VTDELEGRIREICAERVKMSAKPGVPLQQLGPNNKYILDNHEGFVVRAVMERIVLLADMPEGLTPEEMVQGGYCDPVKLFVKSEPHLLEKVQEERFRLIASESLDDQIVERVLFENLNDLEIAAWKHIPSAPGIGLSLDDDVKSFIERVKTQSGGLQNVAQSDMSGWDWSVTEWELLLEARCRLALMRVNPEHFVARVIMNRTRCLANSVFVTPDYELITQTKPGVMKSGSYVTSSANSRIRVFNAWLVGARWAIAMGDDCLEEFVPGAVDKYKLYGHICKQYERAGETFEFCSQVFDKDKCRPVDPSRMAFRCLESKAPLGDRFVALQHELRHHPDGDHIVRVVGELLEVAR